MYLPAEQGGERTAVLLEAACGQAWPSFQIGCAKSAPYCAVSTARTTLREPADRTTSFPAEPHRDEIMVMRGNGQEVRRLAMSRSVVFTNDSYWAQPRAAISPDASLVVFSSNFGIPEKARERGGYRIQQHHGGSRPEHLSGFGHTRPFPNPAIHREGGHLRYQLDDQPLHASPLRSCRARSTICNLATSLTRSPVCSKTCVSP